MTTKPTEPDLVAEVEALLARATPGRWLWILNPKAKQVHLEAQDGPRQYVIDFARWGMNGAQPRFQVGGLMRDAQDCAAIVEGRKHHATWYQTLDHPDANLIARAPELLRRLVEENKRLREVEECYNEAVESGLIIDGDRNV